MRIMTKLDGNFLLNDYIDISIHTSSRVLPVSLLEQVAFHLKRNHDEDDYNNQPDQKEVN